MATNVSTPLPFPYGGKPDEARRAQEAERWLDFVATIDFTSGTVVVAGDLLTLTLLCPYQKNKIVVSGYYEAAAGANVLFKLDGTQIGPTFHAAANISLFPWFIVSDVSAGVHTVTLNGSQNSIICGLSIRRGRSQSA